MSGSFVSVSSVTSSSSELSSSLDNSSSASSLLISKVGSQQRKYQYQYSSFISAGTDYPGTLSDVTPETESLGFLSFVRLIGTAYFNLNVASFSHCTPQAHFNNLSEPNLISKQHHLCWLDEVRSTCWVRAGLPADEVPSNDVLILHWRRSVWVIHMWHQCLQNRVELLPITHYGTGMKMLCSSKRCGCVHKGQECGPACKQCGDRCVNTGQTQRNPSSPTLAMHWEFNWQSNNCKCSSVLISQHSHTKLLRKW